MVKIVKIPCDDSKPYEEIEIAIEKGKSGDQLLQFLRVYFNQGTIELDSLKESAAKQFSTESVNLSQDTLERVTAMGSVECFPLSHPGEENGQTKVGLYLDEAGQLKRLPPNRRASALANTCGFNDVPLVGDMFVGRVGPSYGQLSNVDFGLQDLDSTKALWLKNIQKQNYEHGVRTNRVTMDSEAPPSEGTEAHRGFRWTETRELMDVSVTVPAEIAKISAKDVKVRFSGRALCVQIRNTSAAALASPFDPSLPLAEPQAMLTLLDIPVLGGAIRADESTWSVSGREVEVSMEKAGDGSKAALWGKLQ